MFANMPPQPYMTITRCDVFREQRQRQLFLVQLSCLGHARTWLKFGRVALVMCIFGHHAYEHVSSVHVGAGSSQYRARGERGLYTHPVHTGAHKGENR